MAYRDENGRITIDEQAAQKDIRRLREAANILKDSRAYAEAQEKVEAARTRAWRWTRN